MTTCSSNNAPRENASLERVRAVAANLARVMLGSCPPGRERTLAQERLEEAVMWAERAIEKRPMVA